MKVVLQRVLNASVSVNGAEIARIDKGFMALVGVFNGDTLHDVKVLSDKTANLRVFSDENGKMNKSIQDENGEILVVSNFTLCANCKHGRRPSFEKSSNPKNAKYLYETYGAYLSEFNIKNVKYGIFGENMEINIKNDGPVTIILDSKEL